MATAASPQPTDRDGWKAHPLPAVLAAAVVGVLIWSYSSAAVVLAVRWWSDPDYTYGFLVPVFSGVLLWRRRGLIPRKAGRGSVWGIGLLAVGAGMRWMSAYFYFALLDPLSLVPCLAGLVVFVGGWGWLRWTWPAIAFLGFMVPLPGTVAGMLSHPLQRIGTAASTFLLQLAGMPAVAQGNVILLTQTRLNVVEACSGLRMMMLFLAVCFAAAFLVRRPLLDRLVILLSAIPISLLANVIRITLTGILQETLGPAVMDFHALAGWLMMPLAVLLLWGEMELMSRLLVPQAPTTLLRPVVQGKTTSRRRKVPR